ncbi:MAG: VCBS repeat-containing protein [Planctomycetes bacterium]|nr:VCBS repeat-containing protein [Planctomycetota bacterium]
MDVNEDGRIDILSGSYSRKEKDMAGLFQVLWGTEDGGFAAPEPLCGTDGKPLIIAADDKHVTDKICTRPTAVDLDGDGDLDLVVGNFSGTFAVFEGQGEGKFASANTWLESDGNRIAVRSHGDPCFVDWDGDGDLDLVSGSAQGGVFLFRNEGSEAEPSFAHAETVLDVAEPRAGDTTFGAAHMKGPQHDTRVFVADVNGDGKFDLILGDAVRITYPAEGLDEDAAREQLGVWQKGLNELVAARVAAAAADKDSFDEKYADHWKLREKIIRSVSTGYVWVMLQK